MFDVDNWIDENIDEVAAKPSEKALAAFNSRYEEVVTRSHRLEDAEGTIEEAVASLNMVSYTDLGGKQDQEDESQLAGDHRRQGVACQG